MNLMCCYQVRHTGFLIELRPAFISAKQLGYRAILVQTFQYWTGTEFGFRLQMPYVDFLTQFARRQLRWAGVIGRSVGRADGEKPQPS